MDLDIHIPRKQYGLVYKISVTIFNLAYKMVSLRLVTQYMNI